ncbi:Predicted arabinose efflux permease, MFS family [Roseomonas rosea]|uniref:Predicted arabinose efflux permease, MFS family n=1 Tax=Muricoccus roseus TaxID=198092 RepID=A0A1M6ASS7_9PROT|nr:MFS transporter [Roseomonas rosea]SHI39522.1 Predicted arabinose efflux permease, MFS family [Roseomonas rosea]
MQNENVPADAAPDRDWRIIGLIGTGHFLSHFYMLCLAPLFPIWREEFGVSYAVLGLSVALMSAVTALLQTPVGFLVDRHGARPYLLGGTLIMALSISAMALAPSYWVILGLAVLSGIGNSVIHPADYAILGSSIGEKRMGRAFAMHTFTGNLGFAAAPLVLGMMVQTLGIGWRPTLLALGLLGLPVVAAIMLQSRILKDQARPKKSGAPVGRQVLFSRTMLMFFAFFLLSSMAGVGVQSFLIATLDRLWGTPLAIASLALTGYVVGATSGVLIGGWYADRYSRHFTFVTGLTALSIVLFLAMGLLPLPDVVLPVVALVAGAALGASRTPRDVMVKNAAPPGEIGKVFGFISSGLPLGGAITPVPFGLMLDNGMPWLVLPTVALLLLASLFCAGTARGEALRQARAASPSPLPAE